MEGSAEIVVVLMEEWHVGQLVDHDLQRLLTGFEGVNDEAHGDFDSPSKAIFRNRNIY